MTEVRPISVVHAAGSLLRSGVRTGCVPALGLALLLQIAPADQTPAGPTTFQITSVHQIRLLASQTPDTSYSIHLEGDVWWVDPRQGKFVLKDESGAELLEMNLPDRTIQPGA